MNSNTNNTSSPALSITSPDRTNKYDHSKIASLLNRRYLYTINFAAQNPDQNIAPYLAITQVYDANLTLLDSIANKLTNKVKASKYGIEFLNLLEKRRKNEKN
mgnify:CR=1 FL=1